jgi:tetratricopeptide (TPR) repeat protein
MRRRRVVALALLVVAAASPAFAKPEAAKPEARSSDATGKPKISEYDQLLVDANKAFVAGLAGGAIDDAIAAYRKAIANDPARPEGHLFLAGALFQKGELDAAGEAASQAAGRAGDRPNVLGKALFLSATILDAQAKPTEARAAWAAYAAHATAHPDQPFPKGSGDAPPMRVKVWPANAADRLAKLDAREKAVADYAKVRELIDKRQKELGIPAPKP